MVGRFSGAEEGQLVLDGFTHKEAPEADAQEKAQEDAQSHALAASGRPLVEHRCRSVENFGIHRVEVALHRGDRVGMVENFLYVEKVEAV